MSKQKGSKANSQSSTGLQGKQHVIALAQANRLTEARTACEKFCKKNKDDSEAWFLLGAIHGHMHNFKDAAACCRRAIKITPHVAMGHYNLGIALHRTHDYAGAVTSFQQAIRLQPDFAEAHHELGNSLQAKGEPVNAINSYKQAINFQPALAAAHLNLANTYRASDRKLDAITSYQDALKADSSLLEAHLVLSDLLTEQGQFDDAELHLREVVKLKPDYVEAKGNLGNLLQKRDRHEEAVSCYRAVLEKYPESAEAYFNLGNALRSMGETEEALASYKKAHQLNPQMASVLNNMGLIYLDQGELDEAIRLFEQSLEIDPLQAEARINLSKTLRDNGKLVEAAELLQDLLQDFPEHTEAHWDLSLVWLQAGNFLQGWQEYEWRLKGGGIATRPFPQSCWEGESLEGKTILVYAEQGVGDELMFASCFPDLIKLADHVIIDCDMRLASLFQRSFPGTTIRGGSQSSELNWLADLPPVDVQCAAGSLPRHLRPDLDSFPRHTGYLIPEPSTLAHWRERYKTLGTGLKVGISWRGGHVTKTKIRSTHLLQWRDILSVADMHFVNLQYGACETELAEIKQSLGVDVHDWEDADPLQNLDNFAAQVAALDLIISVDNATVHMAGALGIEVWVLQPFVPDWRWLTGRDDSYWYPSMRHFQQLKHSDWTPVISKVQKELELRSGNK